MPRLVVVLPLTPLQIGASFVVEQWPLHITVLAPFETDAAPTDIAQLLSGALTEQPPLTVVAGPDEMFGRRHNIPVTVIVDDPALMRLHARLIETLRPLASNPNEPAFDEPAFRAHVTVKLQGRVHAGDELRLTQIALVDMAPRAAPSGRTVLSTLTLGHPRSR